MPVTLASVTIDNFRCFDKHTIEFQTKSLLVGKNNAGKSTCIEALRMVSLVTERMHHIPFRAPPKELELPKRLIGLTPSLNSIAVHREGVFNRYKDPPATIIAKFTNGSRIEIYLGKKLLFHAVIYDERGKIIGNRGDIDRTGIPQVSILPQIGPLAESEDVLDETYVRSHLQTSRCSLHFRNQLYIFPELFPHFVALVSSTWPGLNLDPIDAPQLISADTRLSLIVRDHDFAAEVSWMGHGLQMWLQTMWFLTRNQAASTLILDEPDVYMHADLQRKLVRMLLRDTRQFVVATHSPEMLAEVQPDSVIVLDRTHSVSKSATSIKAVQSLLDHVGSVHNISLARLAMYRRLLLVEGEDVAILKTFQNAFEPNAPVPIDAIPNCDIEGWSKWPSVITMARFIRQNMPDDPLSIHCVFDRDYHTNDEIQARLAEAKKFDIHLHIWSRKELENYALVAAPIARIIERASGTGVTTDDVSTVVEKTCNSMRDETIDAVSEEFRIKMKVGANVTNPKARQFVEERWKNEGGLAVVGGKTLFSAIAKWSQDNYGVSLSPSKVIREMLADEVPKEVSDFIQRVTARDEES